MSKLKDCPFYGKAPGLLSAGNWKAVSCVDPNCAGYSMSISHHGEERAITAWNRRAAGCNDPEPSTPQPDSVPQDSEDRAAFDEFMESWERAHRVSRHNPSTREAFENGYAMARAALAQKNQS